MMRKITNWTLGSVFRTLGRFFAYLILALLFGLIVKNMPLKLVNLLGIEYVNASELKEWSYSVNQLGIDENGTINFTSWENTPYTWSPNYPVERIRYRLRSSDGLVTTNSYNFTWGYRPDPDSLGVKTVQYWKNGTSEITSSFTCGQWYRNDYNYYLTDCSFTPPSDFSASDELWITIQFYESYQTSIRPYVFGYDERLGTNAVITDTGNNIINNNNQNTQEIINNQNENTQAIIDANKVCTSVDKNNIIIENSYLNYGGEVVSNNQFGVTDFINIEAAIISDVNTYTNNWEVYSCFYNVNKELIRCVKNNSFSLDFSFPVNSKYAKFSIQKSLNQPQFKFCFNGNQAVTDALTDDSSPDISSLNDMAGWLPPGPIDSILNLPLTYLNSLTTALGGSCSVVKPTLPYINKEIELPCIKSIYENINAMGFVNWVGAIVSALILFKYFMNLYKWVDDTLTFRENNWLDNWGGM